MISGRHLPDLEDASRPVRFVARQAIMSSDERVIGYELLFRSGLENFDRSVDPDEATRSVIDISNLLGPGYFCNSRLVFINCTRNALLDGCITLLPPGRVVLEILEDIVPDPEVLRACSNLKSLGYRLALDDFTTNDLRDSLSRLVDFIKVDLRLTAHCDLPRIVAQYGSPQCRMIAEKVETREELSIAERAGFRLFQGYFFQKPEVMRGRSLLSDHATTLRLLQAVSKPELDWNEVEDLIKRDAALSFRVLRHINSAKFGLCSRIKSLRHALCYLGEGEVRRWCRLSILLGTTQERKSELILCAATRARFLELLGREVADARVDLFLLGMLSLMDSILDISRKSLTDLVPLDEEIESLLLGKKSSLSPLFRLALGTESGDWGAVSTLCENMHLSEQVVAGAYWEAQQWAYELCSIGKAAA